MGVALVYGLYLSFHDPHRCQGQIYRLEKGTSFLDLGRQLENAGLVSSRYIFWLSGWIFAHPRQVQAGEYEFKSAHSLAEIFQKLEEGKTYQRRFTVIEGMSTREILPLLNAAEGLLGGMPVEEVNEGDLLPDTYFFSYGDSKKEMIQRIKRRMEQALDTVWRQRPLNCPLKTKAHVVILASLVEKETSLPSERPRVAAVYLNRLRMKMPLQADPTVVYALEQATGMALGRPLSRTDLKVNSPYNTYLHAHLPPTPICHPSLSSLQAVVHPVSSQDLYFVADGTGGHIFSKTYAEHQKHHQKWRLIKSQQSPSVLKE